jgi:glycosyltransferase involved in cell wall biosynthesis
MGDICENLQALGHKVTVLTPYTPEFDWKQEDYTVNLRTYKYIFPNRLHLLGYGLTLKVDIAFRKQVIFLSPFLFLFCFLSLWRLVRRDRPDILHAHWVLPNGFIGALVARITKVPLAISIPGSDILVSEMNFIFRWMARFAFKTANLITTNSSDLRDSAIKIGAKPEKFKLIIYGVDPGIFRPDDSKTKKLRKKLGIKDKETVILTVGRLVYKKGFDILIKSIPLVIKDHSDVKVIIVGEGDLKDDLINLACSLGVREYVLFVGNVMRDEISDYYNMADIFAMPSVMRPVDGLNVCVVEAMSCGKPIIGSNVGGNPLVVQNGKNGFLFNEKNSTQLASCIVKLVTSPFLRKKFGERSREMILKEFNWEKLAQRYINAFNKLLEGKCSP